MVETREEDIDRIIDVLGIAYLAGPAEALRSHTGPAPAETSLTVLNKESEAEE